MGTGCSGVWRARWVFLAWWGAPGIDYSGITMSSFAGAGGLVCLVGSQLGFGYLLCFLCALVSFPLCWPACLGVTDGEMDYNHSLAGLKSGAE